MSYILIIFSGIFGIIGVVFCVIGIAMLNNKKKKERNCISKTYGKVTDIVKHERYSMNGGYVTSWYPVIEYNIGGLKYIKEAVYGGTQTKYAIGQDVEIYYNPKDCNEFYIAGETLPKTLGAIFTIIGVGAITIAIFSTILML